MGDLGVEPVAITGMGTFLLQTKSLKTRWTLTQTQPAAYQAR